jgi:HEAT repeat protein
MKALSTRAQAAHALGKIGDKRALLPLFAALIGDEEPHVRSTAAQALAAIGDTRAVEPLTAALKDQESYVRMVVAKSLGELGDERAVDSLVTALKDTDASVRKSAATSLAILGSKPANKSQKAHYLMALQRMSEAAEICPHVVSRNLQAVLARHEVTSGDTLSEIAKQYGVKMRDILLVSDIPNRDRIRPGQVLVIPPALGDEIHAEAPLVFDLPILIKGVLETETTRVKANWIEFTRDGDDLFAELKVAASRERGGKSAWSAQLDILTAEGEPVGHAVGSFTFPGRGEGPGKERLVSFALGHGPGLIEAKRVALKIEPVPWGEPVSRMQTRLWAETHIWPEDEVPYFFADFRNEGNLDSAIRSADPPGERFLSELEFDGDWYSQPGDSGKEHVLVRAGAETRRSLFISTDWGWRRKSDREQLKIGPGKHVVRLALTAYPPSESGKSVRPVSNPVRLYVHTAEDLRFPQTTTQQKVTRAMGKLRSYHPGPLLYAMRRLSALGPEAARAVPLLAPMAHGAVGLKHQELFGTEARASPRERRLSLEALDTLKQIGEPAVRYLLENLERRELDHRVRTVNLLGELGDRRAAERVIPLLKDEDANIRAAAAQALGVIGDPRAVEPLLDLLLDLPVTGDRRETYEDRRQKYAAMVSLGQLRATEAVEPLLTALEDSRPVAGERALLALGMIYSREDAAEDLVIPSAVVEGILACLEHWNPPVRRQAARAAGKMRLESAAEPLGKMLRDEDEAVRAEAKRVLDELGLSAARLSAFGDFPQ